MFAELHAEGYFDARTTMQGRNRDIWQYLDGMAARDDEISATRAPPAGCCETSSRSTRKAICRPSATASRNWTIISAPSIRARRTSSAIQRLKGMCREWEAECLWGYFGWQSSNIHHLRLGFYTGDIFSPTPTVERDVLPIVRAHGARPRPDVVAVALDPEASGPDTHYKVLQAINEATQQHAEQSGRRDLRDHRLPQRLVPLPSGRGEHLRARVAEHVLRDGECVPEHVRFAARGLVPQLRARRPVLRSWPRKSRSQQYQMLKTCLGREWFAEHPSPLIRAARGLVFLRG